jgi:hypothetical protein
MPLNVSIQGDAEFQHMIELLRFYPEIYDKHMFPALAQAAELVEKGVRVNTPVKEGYIVQTLGHRIVHSGTAALGTSATIGFSKKFSGHRASYAGPLSVGVRPHDFSQARHIYINGHWVTMTHHPGFSGRHMQERGYEDTQAGVNAIIEKATDAIVQELAR